MCGHYRRTTAEENLLAGIIFRYRHNEICRSVGTLLRQRCTGDPVNPESKQRTLDVLRWGLIHTGPKIPRSRTRRSIGGSKRSIRRHRSARPSIVLVPVSVPVHTAENAFRA